ncbi:MAG: MFS transporter [Salinirussus sp.]
MADTTGEGIGVRATIQQALALERDVLVLSVAMFAFSLGFQMTTRFLPDYLAALGASSLIIGVYGSAGNLLSAIFPYPGGAVSDRVGSRLALTLFGLLSTIGFIIWLLAPLIGPLNVAGLTIEPWVWIFVGLILAQGWKSLGLGATFAIVKQAVSPDRLARGFASTETVRRSAFLLGFLLTGFVLFSGGGTILPGFIWVIAIAAGFGAAATIVQHVFYDASEDTVGESFRGIEQLVSDLRQLPDPLRPLLVGDTLVRFANGMVYVFFIIVVTRHLAADARVLGVYLAPPVLFSVLLVIEMTIALVSMVPVSVAAERFGLKPVVAAGFSVYAVFPVLLILAPADPVVLALLFAFSGLRFAGLPSHKALIVGPARAGAGGRVTGAYYLVRNLIVIPSGAIGGLLWESGGPELAFGLATLIGLLGTGYFLAFGREFSVYS